MLLIFIKYKIIETGIEILFEKLLTNLSFSANKPPPCWSHELKPYMHNMYAKLTLINSGLVFYGQIKYVNNEDDDYYGYELYGEKYFIGSLCPISNKDEWIEFI